MELRISPMQPADVWEVAAIERQCFSTPWTEDGFSDTLQRDYALYLSVRTAESPQIIGYCGLLQSFDEAEIVNVAVRGDCRGRGIGYAMLSELLERGRRRGIERFILEVRRSNTAAQSLYEKLGFTTAGVRRRFYEHPIEDAVIMCTPDAEK